MFYNYNMYVSDMQNDPQKLKLIIFFSYLGGSKIIAIPVIT